MLTLHNPTPATPAAQWIQLVWEWKGYCSPAAVERILPHGMVEISWHLNEGHRLWDDHQRLKTRHATVIGPRTVPYFVDTSVRAHLFGIVFQPGAAADFLGLDAEALAGGFFALEDFPNGARLQNRLGEARSAKARLEVVLAFFSALRPSPRNREATFLLRTWQDAHGRGQSIQSLREALGISAPTLVRRTRRQLGLRPAELRQILMFKEAVETLAARDRPLVHAALDVGYCDQPHLNRSFRRHAGITPRHFNPFSPEHPFNLAACI